MIVAPLLAAAVLAVAAPSAPPRAATLLAAGDISSCSAGGDEKTAALLERLPGTIAALGDILYDGTYAECYAWAAAKARTRPALGNHDYEDGGAAYFAYWSARVGGGPARGWYSYDLGRWHVVVLNSNCDRVGCGADSPQVRWLRGDLRAHRGRCTLAYWHHPRFSSGRHGSNASTQPFWAALQAARAEIVLGGHDHDYERFAPQTGAGRASARVGIRQFVVGTGGRSAYEFPGRPLANSVVRANAYGVLRLTLLASSYRWEFVAADDSGFRDRGSARCR